MYFHTYIFATIKALLALSLCTLFKFNMNAICHNCYILVCVCVYVCTKLKERKWKAEREREADAVRKGKIKYTVKLQLCCCDWLNPIFLVKFIYLIYCTVCAKAYTHSAAIFVFYKPRDTPYTCTGYTVCAVNISYVVWWSHALSVKQLQHCEKPTHFFCSYFLLRRIPRPSLAPISFSRLAVFHWFY